MDIKRRPKQWNNIAEELSAKAQPSAATTSWVSRLLARTMTTAVHIQIILMHLARGPRVENVNYISHCAALLCPF